MNRNFYACISGKIMNGEPIRIAYREGGHGPGDSGWKIMSGTEDELYASNPDNVHTMKIKELLAKFPELKSIIDAKAGSLFEADENGKLVLHGVDKGLKHISVRLFTKKVYVVSPGAPVFITADVENEKTFLKKKR